MIDLGEARKRLRPAGLGQAERPKILETLDLAEAWQRRLEAGGVNRADLAREGGVSRARVTQILKLMHLHPEVLRWVREHARSGSEYRLRPLLCLPLREQLLAAERRLPGFAGGATA